MKIEDVITELLLLTALEANQDQTRRRYRSILLLLHLDLPQKWGTKLDIDQFKRHELLRLKSRFNSTVLLRISTKERK